MAFSNEQHRRRYAENPEHRRRKLAANRVYRVEHRERLSARWYERWRSDAEFRQLRRARFRKKKYGLGGEDYERMRREQNGVCAICKRKSHRELCVDHCHATRMVRGLLCHKCNIALGLLDDDSDRMREAEAYLNRARSVREGGAGSTSPPPAPRSK